MFLIVWAQVKELETDPLFNSGRGSALTEKGTVEMEASIMDGPKRRCGAVSGLTTVKNPVSLARLVMEKSPHSYLAFSGAEEFARQQVSSVTFLCPYPSSRIFILIPSFFFGGIFLLLLLCLFFSLLFVFFFGDHLYFLNGQVSDLSTPAIDSAGFSGRRSRVHCGGNLPTSTFFALCLLCLNIFGFPESIVQRNHVRSE